ncbi:MAG: DUF465 domain-containing protein [Phyllobacteriaceae bacterium]|nr:DUF465 domain-containing protein [Phyllobacteriaceae bacterium]
MAMESHIAELQKKHGEIERALEDAMAHPSVGDLEIADMKRRKLALKDEIERLKTGVTHH